MWKAVSQNSNWVRPASSVFPLTYSARVCINDGWEALANTIPNPDSFYSKSLTFGIHKINTMWMVKGLLKVNVPYDSKQFITITSWGAQQKMVDGLFNLNGENIFMSNWSDTRNGNLKGLFPRSGLKIFYFVSFIQVFFFLWPNVRLSERLYENRAVISTQHLSATFWAAGCTLPSKYRQQQG